MVAFLLFLRYEKGISRGEYSAGVPATVYSIGHKGLSAS